MIKIGVICPSEIAFRRFMPALKKVKHFEFIGISICNEQERFGEETADRGTVVSVLEEEYKKAKAFITEYSGKIFNGYEAMINSGEIDAIYIPLPPALHYKWAKKALQQGIHVLVEKPATINLEETRELIKIASERKLAFYENYMFVFHQQLKEINDIVLDGGIGDVRLYRITFGFPKRMANDFRYHKQLGGGALIDAGGYTLKYAAMLLGDEAYITTAKLNYTEQFDVDIYGSATMENPNGCIAQIAFGMDNGYTCELEVWGSKGTLTTGRVLTAPVGFVPEVEIKKQTGVEKRKLSADDSFFKSIMKFEECIENEKTRRETYAIIEKQSKLIEDFRYKANKII